ncbi:EGF domain-containing protein [Vulgatibacter sp.]|uniref:EGF domain-containing protein n=1 Tax=Vulgatibacter sp. TaxID=1971226 RepID=UPI00356851CB
MSSLRGLLLLLPLLALAACGDDPRPGAGRPGDPCSAAACDEDATCTVVDGAAACICNEGYAGDGATCADVDECTEAGICGGAGSFCSNLPGGYECGCLEGFEPKDGACADVDECALGTDSCAGDLVCVNRRGGFDCECPAGYHDYGSGCEDVDECFLGTAGCAEEAICTNTPGGFTCACDEGYSGDGATCVDVDECATGNGGCGDDATCFNRPGTRLCICDDPGETHDGTACVPTASGWQPPVVIGPGLGGEEIPWTQPQAIDSDADGNLFVLLSSYGANVHMRRYDAATGSWGNPTLLAGDEGYESRLAVAPAGDALVAWTTVPVGEVPPRVMVRRYEPSAGWGPATEITRSVSGERDVLLRGLAVDDQGNAVVAWSYSYEDGGWTRYGTKVRVLEAGATTWSEKATVPGAQDGARIALHRADGQLHLAVGWAWDDVATIEGRWDTAADSWTWDGQPMVHGTDAYDAVVGYDAAGELYAAWAEQAEEATEVTVRVRRRSTSFAGWEPATFVHVGGYADLSLQIAPGAADQALVGFVAADDEGSHGWVARYDGTWFDAVRVDPEDRGGTEGLSIDLHVDGRCVAVWSDLDEAEGDLRSIQARVCDEAGELRPVATLEADDTIRHVEPRAHVASGSIAAAWTAVLGEPDGQQAATAFVALRPEAP